MVARQVKVIRGINVSKVDKAILKAFIAARGIPHTSESLTDLVEGYGAWVEKGAKDSSATELAVCENCGASSVEELDQCPVCGDIDDSEEDEEEPASEPGAKGEIQTTAEPVLAEGDDIASSIQRLRSLLAAAMTNYWRLGRELLRVYESKSYKTIVDENEQPRYMKFSDFALAEIGISGGQARTLMNAAQLVTEEQFERIGSEKIRLVARLPPEQREKALAVAADKTVAQLREELRASRPKVAAPPVEEVPASKKADRKKKVITCTFETGKTELPLRKSGENAFIASEELIDGVRIFYEVQIKKRSSVLVIKRERVEEGAGE